MGIALQTSYPDTPATAMQGQLDNSPREIRPAKNVSGASQPFGTLMVYKPGGGTTDLDVLPPANSTDSPAGFLHRTDSYSRSWTDSTGTYGELDATGVRDAELIDLARKGRIWVKCTTGCKPGDRLFVAYNNTGATYTAVGQLGNAAEAGHTIDCTGSAVWDSTAAAGGSAWLKFDFTNK